MTPVLATVGSAGLTGAEAQRRLLRDGPNEVPQPPPPPLARRVWRQLADPLIALLLASAVVTAVLGDLADTAIILLVVAGNTAIGVAQEVRADRAVAALRSMAAPHARVVRDGHDRWVPAGQLVTGDLVRLTGGDVVPADLRLLDARQLRLDEAAMTGESVPVGREAGDEAHAGTVVVAGRADGVVVRTGPASALGQIADLVARAHPGPTPLQRRLAHLGRVLGAVAVAVSAVVTLVGVLAGRDVVDMAITGVSLVVAAVPESLPAVVTLALALGARRMAQHRAIPRRLTAVETLGSVTVLASDKTGTLTEGRMSVRTAVLPDGTRFTVAGAGYAPRGEVRGPDGAPPGDRLAALARAAVLCNDAHLAPPAGDGPWQAVGDPLEAALLAFAARAGVDAGTVRARHPRDGEEPFDAATRRMVTRHGDLTVCKGAPEVVLTPALVEADPATLAAMRGYAAELAAAGLRVLAVAASAPDGGPLRPLGLLGIGDPVRAGAHRVVRACRDAGIENVIVTGDHPATAVAVARELGIWRDGDRAAGGGTGHGDGDVHGVRVFARTRPEQKLGIVAALQREGHVVAVTGDGVNDAPALRRADIGVAMGAGGTEVARQAADLVLADDELGTVVAAVAEGRRIYANIRRFLRYALSGGLAELLVMLIGPALGLPLPLLPGQILWINLLTHGLPGVAIGAEPPSPQAMRHPPRSPRESVLGGGLGRAVLAIGALIATATLATGVLVAHRDGPWQTMVFLVLGFAQLGVALAVRTRRAAGVPGNPWLPAAVALSAALLVAAVLAPPLRALLGTDPVGFAGLAVAVAVGAVPGLLVALARVVRAAGGRRTHRPGTDDSDLPGSPAHSMN